ncbi:hypothetical protein OAU50_05765 [Planctomycetota bacterium]|nr:hypothetical protein [Planctomycetota bacterium]
MDGDANFTLKAFAVVMGVLGTFLVAFVAQRGWFFLKSRKRSDIQSGSLKPALEIGFMLAGLLSLWIGVEALRLAIASNDWIVQPGTEAKIAEIEIGKADRETNELNLLFYPVDQAGLRIASERRPVLTSSNQFELKVDVLRWRQPWAWLGRGGFYQFQSLGGFEEGRSPEVTQLERAEVPGSMGVKLFLQPNEPWTVRQECVEGEVYDVLFSARTGEVKIRLQQDSQADSR